MQTRLILQCRRYTHWDHYPGTRKRIHRLLRLYVKCKIIKADGSSLAVKEKTGIVNIPLQRMWSQIDTYMNGKLISLNTSYYPWKAYLKLLLSNGSDIAHSRLQSQLFYLDDDDTEDVDPVEHQWRISSTIPVHKREPNIWSWRPSLWGHIQTG